MRKHPIFSVFPCSDAFYQAAQQASNSKTIYCEACKRTICSDPLAGDYERGEYDNLKKAAAADPEGYVFFGDKINSLAWFYYNELQIALDCPCNYARIIEDMEDGNDGIRSIDIPPYLPNKKRVLKPVSK